MAKGFKVIPKEAPPKVEWDYEKIKQRVKGKQIVFCLPGRGCSYVFLKNFVQLCFDLVQNGNGIQISQDYSSMVNLIMIISYGLIVILFSAQRSSGS